MGKFIKIHGKPFFSSPNDWAEIDFFAFFSLNDSNPNQIERLFMNFILFLVKLTCMCLLSCLKCRKLLIRYKLFNVTIHRIFFFNMIFEQYNRRQVIIYSKLSSEAYAQKNFSSIHPKIEIKKNGKGLMSIHA